MAFKSDNDIKLTIRPLEESCIASDKDSLYLDERKMPMYLYDDIWNDVSYLLGINFFLRHTASAKDTILNHLKGRQAKSFDDFWMEPDVVTWSRDIDDESTVLKLFDQDDEVMVYDNVDGFCDDLGNFDDTYHYSSEINSQILLWIRKGEYEITLDNIDGYCYKLEDKWYNFDYNVTYDSWDAK